MLNTSHMSQHGNSLGEWRAVYHSKVIKSDIPKLTKTEALHIKRSIVEKLAADPVLFGLPLRGTLKHYWKLRVGNWRIVYTIKEKEVRILIIAHRNKVYELANNRK